MKNRDRFIMAQVSKEQRSRQGSFGFLLQVLSRRMDARMKERLAEIDVDLKIFANLRMLAERDGVTQVELGRLLEFPEYYTSRNVDTLVEAGLVERRPNPESRRSILVFLTEEGREKAQELPKIIAEVNAEFMTELSAKEKSEAIRLLQKIAGIPDGGDPGL